MTGEAVQAFQQWYVSLPSEHQRELVRWMAQQIDLARTTKSPTVRFGGKHVGTTPPVARVAPTAGNVCPTCHRPLS